MTGNLPPMRQLGKNGPMIPALGLGLMGMSSFYGAVPSDEDRFALLDRAYELGCRHWDTAALYGDSEEVVGKWFARTGKRDEIFLSTKFAANMQPDGSITLSNDPAFIRQSVARSLRLLQTDRIDLLYCHRILGDVAAEDIVGTMKEFVESGQVRYLGMSECGVDTLRRGSKIHPITAYQIEYSPFAMDIEKEEVGLLRACRELGIATVAYSPLGRGMITGQYRSVDDFEEGDLRRVLPRYSRENFGKNLELVERLRALGEARGCTPAQITLAWMLNQGDDVFVIPGTKKIKYLEENCGASGVSLTPDEDRQIREAIENAEVYGTRMPEWGMSGLVKDTPPLKK